MSERETNTDTAIEDDFSLVRVLRNYLRYKWLFILSIIIAGLLAVGYIWWKTPLYRIQSSLVIKDEKKGESSSITIKELDFLDEQKIVDNEAEIIRSETIVGSTVRKMALNIGYFQHSYLIKKVPLFDDAPITVRVIKAGKELYREPIKITPAENGKYQVDGNKNLVDFGDTISLRDGQIQVEQRVKSVEPIYVAIADPEETIQQLRSSISATAPSKNSSVLYISLLHPSPSKGRAILREIIETYEASNILEKRNQTDSIIALIERRLSLIGDQVTTLEAKEQTTKSGRGVTFLSDDARSFLENAKENDKEYTQAQIQLDNINQVDKYLGSNHDAVTAPPNTSLNDPVLTNMVISLNQLQLQKQDLLRKSGPQHPAVLTATRQVEDLTASIRENIRIQRTSLENKLGLLQSNQAKVNERINTVPTSERLLLGLMREKSIRENVYSYLLEKREEASLTDASIFSKMRWIDQPFSSTKPVKPNKLVVLGAALLLSLLISIVIVSFREGMGTRVHLRTINQSLPYPVLGHVPELRKFAYKSFEQHKSIVTEQFRWIRSALEKQGNAGKENGQVILVASPVHNEGKSFISLNLAVNFAAIYENTVLVDFDFRKTKLSTLFPSLSGDEFSRQLQEDTIDLDRLARRIDEAEGLYVICNESPIEDASSILDRADLDSFFRALRQRFRYIIINTPPFTYFPDAFRIESFTDTNILVVREGYTSMQQVTRVRKMIQENRIKSPSIIFNDIPLGELFEKRQRKGYYAYHYQ